MNSAWTVFRKELLDVMRDRRTLLFMLVIPTLSIPVLMWITSGAMTHFLEKLAKEKVDVLVLGQQHDPKLVDELRQRSNPEKAGNRLAKVLEQYGLGEKELALVKGEGKEAFVRLLKKKNVDPKEFIGKVMDSVNARDFDATASNIATQAFPPNFRIITKLDRHPDLSPDDADYKDVLLNAVRTDEIVAAVEIPKDSMKKIKDEDTTRITIRYLETSDRSTMALKGLKRIFKSMSKRMAIERIKAHGLPEGFAAPIEIRAERLPGPGLLVKLMSQFLPYMILIFSFLGALYPAIDLGAGEKERGTLETLLVAPVSRLSLVLGKFGVVLTAALVSSLLATVSLAISLQAGFLSDLSVLSGEAFSFSATEAITAIVMIIPISCIFSALLLALSIFAKSFKEGQAYASPLQMIIILPALVSILPGVKLDWMTASIPIVNVSLALKEIFTGNLDQHWAHMALIFISTAVVAGLLLWFAAWWFRREQVLFRS